MVELLLFPNQLFELSILKSIKPQKIYFIEDPLYYGEGRGLRLNQLRIVYMHVVHKRYLKLLRKSFKVEYYPFDKPFPYNRHKNISYIDPCDIDLEKKIGSTATRIESPSFIMSRDELGAYCANRKGKRMQHRHFYTTVKKKLGLLENVKNMDKYNRAQFSKNVPIPENQYTVVYSKASEWEDAIKWIKTTRFANNPQPLQWDIEGYLTRLPLTSTDVLSWMKKFFTERFSKYGKYQDIIYDKNPLFYHSGASIYLNNGLITPDKVLQMAAEHKTDIESYEGFVRQIIGWREYTRLYYYCVPNRQNFFKFKNKTLSKSWYTGTTGVPIIDKTIVYAMNYGYINHIQRLMVMSNYMTLSEFHPDMIYKWMFEFSLDSYEWVMIFNCYSMGSYSDNGLAMRKPYISSSKYIVRMSNEPRGEWETEWDKKYHSFIKKYKPPMY